MTNYNAFTWALLAALSLAPYTAQSEEAVEINGNIGWYSKYVSDGREDFDGKGMWSGEVTAGYQGFFATVWFAQSDSSSSHKIDYTIGKAFQWDAISAEISYTYLAYGGAGVAPGENDDHEMGIAIACDTCLPFDITPGVEMVYDVEAKGCAAILTFNKSFKMDAFTLEPYALVQYDRDYATAEHDGINHYEIDASATMGMVHNTELALSLSHVFRGNDIRNEEDGGSHDLTWFSVALGFTL